MPRVKESSAILAAKGSWRAKERALTEPRPELGVGPCPSWIQPQAKVLYKKLAKELTELGIVGQTDSGQLVLYCVTLAKWHEAEALVEELGPTFIDSRGVERIRPEVRLCKRLADQVVRFGKGFGLSPAARTGLRIRNDSAAVAD